GILDIKHGNALGATSAGTTVSDVATLQLSPSGAITVPEPITIAGTGVSVGGTNVGALYNLQGSNTWSGPITMSANTSIGAASGTQLTITGAIGQTGGARSLTKVGDGTLVLSAANTYTGGTTVTAGTLKLSGGNDRLATTGNITITGGILDLGGNTQNITGSAVVSFQGGLVQNGTIVNNSTQPYDGRSGTVSANLAGSAGLNKSTSGTLVLSGNNTYTGKTTVSAGYLEIQHGNALGRHPEGLVTETQVADWAVLRLVGGSDGITVENETLKLGASGASGSLINASGNNHWKGGVQFTSTYGSTVNVASGSQLTISGVISGSSQQALTKMGAGTLVLSGANTYTGGTNVNAGKLLVNNTTGSGTGSGQVTVNSPDWYNRSILGGTGTIVGNVVLANYGCITGADIATTGTLTITGDLTVGADILAIDILDAAHDQIVVQGTASLSSINYIEILHGDWIPQGQTNAITILKATNINIQTSNLSFSISCGSLPGYQHQSHTAWNWAIVDLAGGWKGLNLWAAPEPATWLMLLVGGAALGLGRWYLRRRGDK
ncbi:MAG: autotransporter-associated beta strand repeat-containing protein, partial [Thermoguttaceae bacterium]|nr:autotransporter-associated beta strand repeat-containing protein [Thermoguttaceae bacterium]MDW8036651.1 autotransporter-associated beta strand repeat-containing protein [Thermoguttaceae bacterium]